MTTMWMRCGLTTALLGSTALVAAVGIAPAMAAEPVASTEIAQAVNSYRFDIPAGPLGSALTSFGDTAGLKVLVASELVQNRLTGGVSGTLSADQALRQLLSGTGLVWRFTDAGAVTLEKVPAEGSAMQLDPVTVEGKARREISGLTEDSHSYSSRIASVGAKAPVTLREIPQSVSVITRQRIEDQNMTRLEDAMRRTTGVTVLTNDSGRSSIFARGFELDNYMVDGLPSTLSSQMGTQPDLAMFDSIEVLRGPAGLFGGSGEPGGTVNLTRKRARDKFGANGSVTAGSWDSYRTEADATGPLGESKKVRGRVVAAYQNSDSFVNVAHNEGQTGYGTLEFDLTPNTTLSLASSRQDRDITPFNGLPAYADGRMLDVDRSTFIGADWNRFNSVAADHLAELEHRFDDGGFVKTSMRYTDRDTDFKYAYAGGAVNGAGNFSNMTMFAREYGEEALALDAHVSRPFQAFGLTHNVLAGVDYRESDQRTRFGTRTIAGTYSVTNFNSAAIVEQTPNYTTRTNTLYQQYSTYGQLRIKPVAPLTAVIGGRLGNYEISQDNLVNNTNTTQKYKGEFTPYAGLVLDLNDNLSAYASHTEIFQPQTTNRVGNVLIDPQEGAQQEIGLKGEYLDNRVTTQLALFQSDIKNRAVTDSANAGFSVAGDVKTRGIEAEVAGTVMPGWEVSAGYSYLISEYQSAPMGQTYNTWTPKHTVQLWTKYMFEGGDLDGFSVGGGMRAVSGYYGQATGTSASGVRWGQDAYQVFDAQLGYKLTENVDATFTVNNLLDEVYYARTASATTFNYYGDPRSFWLKVGAKF